MSESINDFLPGFLNVLIRLISSENYLIKGGHALNHHLGLEARFSRDFDVSFSATSFPFAQDAFRDKLLGEYNSCEREKYLIVDDTIELKRNPRDIESPQYFGLTLAFNVRLKDGGKRKIWFREIYNTFINIDLSFDEVVEEKWWTCDDGNIRIATCPIIIAEKFRALCWQIDGAIPGGVSKPRPKDFFDIFLVYNLKYNRKLKPALAEIKEVLQKCFEKKKMSLELLTSLDSYEIKEFHRVAYDEQVVQTLKPNSRYKDVGFDQVYSDAMEVLDTLLLMFPGIKQDVE